MAKTSMMVKAGRQAQKAAAGKFPTVKIKSRCNICGRPRAYYRQFGLCRLCLRKFAHEGKLPGVLKSSW